MLYIFTLHYSARRRLPVSTKVRLVLSNSPFLSLCSSFFFILPIINPNSMLHIVPDLISLQSLTSASVFFRHFIGITTERRIKASQAKRTGSVCHSRSHCHGFPDKPQGISHRSVRARPRLLTSRQLPLFYILCFK